MMLRVLVMMAGLLLAAGAMAQERAPTPYDLLERRGLDHLVREVLVDVSMHGLPGDHHYYLVFRTDHPQVRMSRRLFEAYPDEMTIVLQHQFSGLTVSDEAFEVTLTFSDIAERLSVPLAAVTAFHDPSADYTLERGAKP